MQVVLRLAADMSIDLHLVMKTTILSNYEFLLHSVSTRSYDETNYEGFVPFYNVWRFLQREFWCRNWYKDKVNQKVQSINLRYSIYLNDCLWSMHTRLNHKMADLVQK